MVITGCTEGRMKQLIWLKPYKVKSIQFGKNNGKYIKRKCGKRDYY